MTHKLMLAAMLALLSSAPLLAQESPNAFDSRWTPYLGCWTIVQDQYGLSVPVPAGTTVCVRPSGRSGVAVATTVDGKNVLEQTIVADGSSQTLSHQNCTGTAINDWSRDGQRLFTRVDLDCANQPKRSISGISLLAKGEWVEAQATIIDGNSDVRLRRYRRTSDQAASAPAAATAPLSIEDIIEASAKVQSEALEAALDQVNPRFKLNRRVLTQLADNGVSRNVIDLMVAQAFPDKFQVERDIYASGLSGSVSSSSASSYYGGGASVGSSSVYMGSSAYPYPMYDPFYSSYYYYSPFAYPYYWGPYYSYRWGSPFYSNYYNYNYYGAPGSGYYYGSGSSGVDVPARPGSPDSPGGDGVVVNGRGYTRVRPAGSSSSGGGESATPTSRSPGSTRGVRSGGSRSSGSSSDSGSTPNTGSSSSSSSSSGSSGSSGASSGGYSSGSSGGSSGGGGRTAQPR